MGFLSCSHRTKIACKKFDKQFLSYSQIRKKPTISQQIHFYKMQQSEIYSNMMA